MKCGVMKGQVRWLALALLLVISIGGASSAQSLVEAVKAEDVATARELIARHVDVNAPQADGATALHWAVYRDDIETAKLLIEAGANVDATNDFGVMPLSLACTNGNASMIETLLKAGADSNASLSTGETLLMTAARTGKLDAVVVLLRHGADVNAKESSQEQTALMWALSEKHTEVARKLIEYGADIHAETPGGFTPLLFACREGDLEAARLILDAGADVNTTTSDKKGAQYAATLEFFGIKADEKNRAMDGMSALHVATLRGHGDVVDLLLDRGADPNYDGPGYTALHWAAGTWDTELTGPNSVKPPKDHEWNRMRGVREGKLDMLKALMDHGADPNALLQKNPPRHGFTYRSSRPKGATPFFLAAMAGDAASMRLLVDYGADPLIAAENGVTPLIIATGVRKRLAENNVSESDALAAVKLAVELGADVNAADVKGDTPLHGAARIKSAEIVQFLVDNGADVNVLNELGQSPLFVADRHWPPGIDNSYSSPSAAGELLRKLTPPDVFSEAMEEWAIIPPHIRKSIESLLEGALDNPSLKVRRDLNPIGRIVE